MVLNYCWLKILILGIFLGFVSLPSRAETNLKVSSEIPQLSELELPATSANVLVQAPANPSSSQKDVIQITGVKANPTDKGVEVILETTQGDKLQVANRSTGNNFIADISGGQLRLPNGGTFTFKSEKTLAGITEITVTNINVNTVRVTVVGEKVLPKMQIFILVYPLLVACYQTQTVKSDVIVTSANLLIN